MRNNERETVLAAHRRHAKAWERRSIDELRDIYASNAVIFYTEPPARFSDFKTFENNVIQYFGPLTEVSFLTSNIQIEVVGGVAWVSSLYLRVYREDTEMVRDSGRWTEVYFRESEENDWKLVHFHASADPGPGPSL